MTNLYSGHGWKVTLDKAKLPDGRVKEVARVERADSVHLIACVDEERILLLREFRPYYQEYIWMLPGGRVDKENDLLEGAQRELQEETGYRAEKFEHLWSMNNSESIASTNHVILAKNLTPDPLPQDEDELIEVHICTPEEALQKIETSSRIHTPSAYAIRRFIDERQLS